MLGWVRKLFNGRKTALVVPAEARALKIQETKPSTVTLPPTVPRPDLVALQEKFSKGPKKRRRHDKRGRGPQLPRYPNGITPGGRH